MRGKIVIVMHGMHFVIVLEIADANVGMQMVVIWKLASFTIKKHAVVRKITIGITGGAPPCHKILH
jgi:hypothetical protein